MENKIILVISRIIILLGKAFQKFGNLIIKLGKSRIFKDVDPRKEQLHKWRTIQGDKTLRMDYDLNFNSIVFDLGGYEGQWSSDIYSRYKCKIYCFEILSDYAVNINHRFSQNNDIQVFPFGLSSRTKKENIYIHNDGTTITPDKYKGVEIKNGQVQNFLEFVNEYNITHIDLMKINIEGAEYELLEYLTKHEFITKIYNIQVQFHIFIPDAKIRMNRIRNSLASTHHLTYQYEFVWENWQLKNL